MSVNSGNSDLGQLDFLNPKNSLKDKGLACSNGTFDGIKTSILPKLKI
jgi:hypothetical protein